MKVAGGVILRVAALLALAVGGLFATGITYREAGGNPGFIGERILAVGILGGLVASLAWLIAMITLAVRARRRGDRLALRTNLLSIGVAAALLVILALLFLVG